MEKEFCLISAEHDSPSSTSGLAHWLKQGLEHASSTLIRSEIRKLIKRSPQAQWTGLVSSAVHQALPEKYRQSIATFRSRHGEFAEKADYSRLHRFADDLDERAKRFGEPSGLVYKGISAFKITETRWIHPLLLHYFAYAEMIADVLEHSPKARLQTLTGSTSLERLAMQMAGSERLAHENKCFGIGRWALEVLQEFKTKPKQAYGEMAEHWAKFSANRLESLELTASSKPRVLFVAYKGRSLQRLEALLPSLTNEMDAEFCLLSNMRGYDPSADAAAARIASLGVKTAWLSDFLSKLEVRQKIGHVREGLRGSLIPFFKEPFELASRSVDLYSLARPIIEEVAEKGSLVSALNVEAAHRVAESWKPNLIVHFEEWEINRALCLAGQSKGIPSVAYYCLSPDHHSGLVRRLPDHLMTSGESLARSFTGNGRWTQDRIKVVGDPLVERVTSINRESTRKQLVSAQRFAPEKPVLLILANYPDPWMSDEDLKRYYKQMLKGASELHASVIVKAHPQQNLERLKRTLEESGAQAPVIVQHADLLDLAAGVDLATVTMSSAVSQILLAQTPLISFQPNAMQNQIEKMTRYRSDAGLPVLAEGDDPVPIFKKLLEDSAFRAKQIEKGLRYVTKHTGPLDGGTAKRVAQFLAEKMENSK